MAISEPIAATQDVATSAISIAAGSSKTFKAVGLGPTDRVYIEAQEDTGGTTFSIFTDKGGIKSTMSIANGEIIHLNGPFEGRLYKPNTAELVSVVEYT